MRKRVISMPWRGQAPTHNPPAQVDAAVRAGGLRGQQGHSGAVSTASQQPWGAGRVVALWAASYLYGSLPVVYWLGQRGSVDLRRAGSGNVGATNLLQSSGATGKALAAAGWLFDASKGAAPPAVARALGAPPTVAALAGALGVAGQCWPITLGFRGGRGISAFVGAAALIDPVAWAASLIPMIVGSGWRVVATRCASTPASRRPSRSRSVPLGCFVATIVFPLACAVRRTEGGWLAPLALSAVIALRRLTAALPDDALAGPRKQPRALVYRLLYDRNTKD